VGQFWVHWWEELHHSRLFRASPTNRGRWIFEMCQCVGGWFLGALMGGGFSSCADGWVVSRRAGGGEPSLSRGGGPSVWAAEF
jgi:hypothetical protein